VRQAVAEFVNNLQTMAARHSAKEADRKTGVVAAAVRQRRQKAASIELLQPALDPGVAQEAQREEKVTRREAAAAEEGSFVSTVKDTRSGRKRTVRVSSSKFMQYF
jgi:hypothetical protein